MSKFDKILRSCLWCKKELPARKRKYCDGHCQYRYVTWQKEKPKSHGNSHLRFISKVRRAANNIRSGRMAVRYW